MGGPTQLHRRIYLFTKPTRPFMMLNGLSHGASPFGEMLDRGCAPSLRDFMGNRAIFTSAAAPAAGMCENAEVGLGNVTFGYFILIVK